MEAVSSHSLGPPTLFHIARSTLIAYRDCLGDIGYAPLDLLGDILAACSPDMLAHIEDSTLQGSGRDLAPLTWPLWLDHLTLTFGGPRPGIPLPPLPEAEEEPAPQPRPGVPPAHYREVYEQRVLELQQRREVSGKRLRQLWEQEAYAKQSKQIQVIKPLARKRGGSAASSSPAQRSSISGASQPAGSRTRLLKKLGLGSSRGGGAQQAVSATVAAVATRPSAARPVELGAGQGWRPLATAMHSPPAPAGPQHTAGWFTPRPTPEASHAAWPRSANALAAAPLAVPALLASPQPSWPRQLPALAQQAPAQQGHSLPYTAGQLPRQAAGPQRHSPSAPPRLAGAQQQQKQPQRGQQAQPTPKPGQQVPGCTAAQADTWDLLGQPAWLVSGPASTKLRQVASHQHSAGQARQQAACPQKKRSRAGGAGLLDNPVLLAPLPKQHKQAHQQQVQGSMSGASGSLGGKQPSPAERGQGGGQESKPQLLLAPPSEGKLKELVLPRPRARTVSAVKKAMQQGSS